MDVAPSGRPPRRLRRARVAVPLVDKDYLANVFQRTLKAAALPHYRVYDLRHTYASLLLAEGAPITYVAAQLGHSSPATTMRYYARWIPSKGKRWSMYWTENGREEQAGTKIWNQR